jgi:hypothetical protein
MFQKLSIRLALAALLLVPLGLAAAQGPTNSSSIQAQAQVPRTIRISGELNELGASTVPSLETVRFTLYQDQQGTIPLWSETQQVEVAPRGRYTVLLGAGTEGGIPLPLFSSMDAHWLGVQLEGQHEQPPVLLVSVPYALKAADAETLGGLPASSFLRSDQASQGPMTPAAKAGREASVTPKALVPITGWGGTNYITKFTGAGTIGASSLFDNGFIGLRTTSPRTDADFNGTLTVNRLTLPQDSGSSLPTWNLDNSAGRFRIFTEPRFGANGTEILTATTNSFPAPNVIVNGFLTASRLRAWSIEFTNPEESFYPNLPPLVSLYTLPYYQIESSGTSFNLFYYFPISLGGFTSFVHVPALTVTGLPLRVGIGRSEPRSTLDVGGEIIATSRLLLARDDTATSQAWHMVNDASLFRLAHQSSLDPQGQAGTTVMVATESNRIGINTDAPTHSLDVAGNIGILGTGHGLIFPDGTVQTSASSPSGAFFGICISNSAGPQTCSCPRLLSQTQISGGQSCSVAGVPGNCTATSQAGPPVTYGACCVCN